MLAPVLLFLAVTLLAVVLAHAFRPVRPVYVPPPPVLPVRRVRTEVPHLLYCYLWAGTSLPIYFGVSNEPEARHERHLIDPRDQWWMARSTGAMVPIRWYPNRDAAFRAERAAIRAAANAGQDIANQVHHPAGRRRAAIR